MLFANPGESAFCKAASDGITLVSIALLMSSKVTFHRPWTWASYRAALVACSIPARYFLDAWAYADLFIASFLGPLELHRSQIGTLIFEFGHFHPGDWERGRQFVEALDQFFGRLPKGWDYSVEVRNQSLLQPEYFEVLRRHGVAHIFNSWSRMPSVTEQMQLPGSFTAGFATARFLLKPGRNYEQAVEQFSPYTEVKEPYPEARMALIDLLTTPAKPGRPGRRFLYVNNRLEGCALWTIYAALAGLLGRSAD